MKTSVLLLEMRVPEIKTLNFLNTSFPFTLSNARTQLSVLPASVPRSGRCRHGEREVHRRDGRLRQPLGVQQHRGHDSPQWTFASTNSLHQQTNSYRSQRMRCRHPSGQRKGWGQKMGNLSWHRKYFWSISLSKTNKVLTAAVLWSLLCHQQILYFNIFGDILVTWNNWRKGFCTTAFQPTICTEAVTHTCGLSSNK